MDAHIEISDLNLSYAWQGFRRDIFTCLNLKVPEGAFVSIYGSNGSGKSSLAKLLLGLLEPDGGYIRMATHTLIPGHPSAIREGHIAYLAQQVHELFFAETVAEELAANNITLESVSGTLIAAMDASQQISTLSGGERQSLALVIFMASKAPLLILDEPTSYLDQIRTHQLKMYLEKCHAEGRTILHFTQYPHEHNWGSHVLDLDEEHPELKKI